MAKPVQRRDTPERKAYWESLERMKAELDGHPMTPERRQEIRQPADIPFKRANGRLNLPHDYCEDRETGVCVICGWNAAAHNWDCDFAHDALQHIETLEQQLERIADACAEDGWIRMGLIEDYIRERANAREHEIETLERERDHYIKAAESTFVCQRELKKRAENAEAFLRQADILITELWDRAGNFDWDECNAIRDPIHEWVSKRTLEDGR